MVRRTLALAVLLLAALPAAAGARVLVVGDSLEVGSGRYLKGQLRGIAGLALDARVGRTSREGLRVLRAKLSRADDVVVFDLGTNDAGPAGLGADLVAAGAIAGDRCLVVPTVVRPRLGGPLTGAVESFAAAHPNVQVVPWRETVAASRGLIRRDGVHGTPAGYALRARLVAETVQACLAGAAPIPGLDTTLPPPSLVPETKAAPRPAASPKPPPKPRATGFRIRAYRRYAPLLGTLALAALAGPADQTQLTIVTR